MSTSRRNVSLAGTNIPTPFCVYRDVTGEAAVAISDAGARAAPDRLGVLFDTHHRRLYLLARRLSSTADDARDLVQETFLRAARAPKAIPSGTADEEAWLVRVLVNLCRDQWRRRAIRRRLGVHGGMVHAAGPADPESAAVARSIVWLALRAIAPRRRAVLVMHELEGIGVEAIARTLGVAAVTVRWHLSRGRQELAQAIREQDTRSMRSLHTHLKDGDPVAHEPPPSNEEIQRLRRAVLAAAGAPRSRLTTWRRSAWAMAGALAVVATAAGVSRWSRTLPDNQSISSDARVDSPSRQLQFATPGGTRVIWVFNPDFQP